MDCWFGIWRFWPRPTNQMIEHVEYQDAREVAASRRTSRESRSHFRRRPTINPHLPTKTDAESLLMTQYITVRTRSPEERTIRKVDICDIAFSVSTWRSNIQVWKTWRWVDEAKAQTVVLSEILWSLRILMYSALIFSIDMYWLILYLHLNYSCIYWLEKECLVHCWQPLGAISSGIVVQQRSFASWKALCGSNRNWDHWDHWDHWYYKDVAKPQPFIHPKKSAHLNISGIRADLESIAA